MKIRLSLTGTAPLLMHNSRLANPLDPLVREMKVISGKRKKTDEDLASLARLEFDGGLYMDPVVGPYLPGANIEKSLVEGARVTKQGKQVERGLFVIDNEVPLLYQGPRTSEELWSDPSFRSFLSVKQGMARIMRTRPLFREWKAEADLEVDPALLNVESVEQIATDAGQMIGIGDYRPRYGRYTASVVRL